jgi:hypothetical protein
MDMNSVRLIINESKDAIYHIESGTAEAIHEYITLSFHYGRNKSSFTLVFTLFISFHTPTLTLIKSTAFAARTSSS